MYVGIGFNISFMFVLNLYRVIGVDIEDWKLKLAKDMGTDIVINSKEKDLKQVYMHICFNIMFILTLT